MGLISSSSSCEGVRDFLFRVCSMHLCTVGWYVSVVEDGFIVFLSLFLSAVSDPERTHKPEDRRQKTEDKHRGIYQFSSLR